MLAIAHAAVTEEMKRKKKKSFILLTSDLFRFTRKCAKHLKFRNLR